MCYKIDNELLFLPVRYIYMYVIYKCVCVYRCLANLKFMKIKIIDLIFNVGDTEIICNFFIDWLKN